MLTFQIFHLQFIFKNANINLNETFFKGGIFMQKFIQKYSGYFEPKAVQMIHQCLIISIITCLLGLLLFSFYHTYYISIFLYEASLIIFRTGIMIGLFPIAFTLVIGKWKKENN